MCIEDGILLIQLHGFNSILFYHCNYIDLRQTNISVMRGSDRLNSPWAKDNDKKEQIGSKTSPKGRQLKVKTQRALTRSSERTSCYYVAAPVVMML